MSEEQEENRKKSVGGFEHGLRSALERAPGLAAPSWATMQTAMAGGAAGGAAAASWRWIVGPVAGAAMIGGALWFTDPAEPKDPRGADTATAISQLEEDGVDSPLDSEFRVAEEPLEGAEVSDPDAHRATHPALVEVVGESQLGNRKEANPKTEGRGGERRSESVPEPVPVPEDWEDLPSDRAAGFAVDIQAACVGTEIGFRMARPLKDIRVLWNFGDGQFSSDAAPQHVFKAPGTYDITLSVTRISDGLIRTRTIENLVTIHPRPEADFTWEVPATAESNPSIQLRDRSRDAASSTWIIDGESSRSGQSVAFQLDRVGEHRVQLVASSPEGCQSVMSHDIEVGSRFGLGASARFSPDGDGRYDTFFPRKLLNDDLSFVFRVEDEKGRIVHETTGVEPWGGQLPDGGQASAGQRYRWTAILQGDVGPSYFSDEVVVE